MCIWLLGGLTIMVRKWIVQVVGVMAEYQLY